jgi:hypothetical protein
VDEDEDEEEDGWPGRRYGGRTSVAGPNEGVVVKLVEVEVEEEREKGYEEDAAAGEKAGGFGTALSSSSATQ